MYDSQSTKCSKLKLDIFIIFLSQIIISSICVKSTDPVNLYSTEGDKQINVFLEKMSTVITEGLFFFSYNFLLCLIFLRFKHFCYIEQTHVSLCI